jgi:hypothetical protein
MSLEGICISRIPLRNRTAQRQSLPLCLVNHLFHLPKGRKNPKDPGQEASVPPGSRSIQLGIKPRLLSSQPQDMLSQSWFCERPCETELSLRAKELGYSLFWEQSVSWAAQS